MATTSICTGTATLWSDHPNFSGPTPHDLQFRANFPDSGGTWSATDFKPIEVKDIDTRVGRVTLTVTLVAPANGQREAASGAMSVRAQFKFKFSTGLITSSTLDIALDTETAAGPPPQERPKGKPYAADSGTVTLAGTGILSGGALNGVKCTVSLTGSFAPRL